MGRLAKTTGAFRCLYASSKGERMRIIRLDKGQKIQQAWKDNGCELMRVPVPTIIRRGVTRKLWEIIFNLGLSCQNLLS